MERSIERDAGGIVSLADTIIHHGRALNYDLLTRTGRSLYECPTNGLTWADVRDFIEFLDASSALVSEMSPDTGGWQGDQKTPMLLAHIADLLAGLSYSYTLCHLKKGAQKPNPPEPIPRPGISSTKEEQHFGSGAIPISEFDAWWNREE